MVVLSKWQEEYFNELELRVNQIYDIAKEAKSRGLDPSTDVESPIAKDLAGRVETLIGPKGIAKRLRELKMNGLNEDEIIFEIATEILDKKLGNIESKDERVDRAIRAALAIKTQGVVSAPLEGISRILIRKDNLGNSYLSLYFAGPIRAAGGTTTALCVLLADMVRKKINLPKYKATEGEIGRMVEEIKLYNRILNLQYPASNEEIRFAVKNLPVEINGDPTEKEEVSGFRDLPRIETNRIRGGACLVLNDGILLKKSKLQKITKEMNLSGWEWLDELIKVSESGESKLNKENIISKHQTIVKNEKFIADIIAGRPVFSYPSEIGGHRIRYGRSRNSGLAACGMHPVTMTLLDNFVAIGTQVKIERPGKSASIVPVSSIETPIVLLKNGNVVKIKTKSMANELYKDIEKILFLGDILIGFGEFVENNHILLPSGYCEEWWALDLKNSLEKNKEKIKKFPIEEERLKSYHTDFFKKIPSAEEAIAISKILNIPLHPVYTDFWNNLTLKEIISLRKFFIDNYKNGILTLDIIPEIKSILEKAFIPHRIIDNKIVFSKAKNKIYEEIFGLKSKKDIDLSKISNIFDLFNSLSAMKIKNMCYHYIGSRMGRPEKSEEKKMKPPIHVLFPLTKKVGSSRTIQKAIELGKIKIDICRKKCPNCNTITIFNKCNTCGTHTKFQKFCPNCKKFVDAKNVSCPYCNGMLKNSTPALFNFKKYINSIMKEINHSLPNVKGVYGLTNLMKVAEPLQKGILRALHGVFVYKDGTIRYDATDLPLTHFKPNEIGTSIKKLIEFGYLYDIYGKPLENDEQILELKVQDILLSEHSAKYFVKVANFLDDELKTFYNINPFYNIKNTSDLIGQIFIGLAPHTSAGIIGRAIGFSSARAIYAHPFWHAAKRRNCFPGDTEVLIDLEGKTERITFRKLYEDLYMEENFEKMVYIKRNPKKNIKVYSFDIDRGKVVITDIEDVIKAPITSYLTKINLVTGRSFETTSDHPVIVYNNGKIIEKRAFEIKKGDLFLLPKIEIIEENFDEIDLIKIFSRDKFKIIWNNLMIRGIKFFTKTLIKERGLKNTAEILNINKKTLCNYYGERDSIPLNILIEILKLNDSSIEDIPDCFLGFKRDHTFVKRKIKMNKSLMKLIGYYLAEGFYRKGQDTYQVDLAVSEEDLKNDMMQSIRTLFGDGFNPYINENRITIANRVIYHFFKDILKLKNRSPIKRIPSFIFKLPKKKLKYLIGAYFSGDGGVDKTRKTIACSSYSKELLKDFDLLLLRFGIFSSIYTSKRDIGIEYKLVIRGENVLKFRSEIGFTSQRKKEELNNITEKLKVKPQKKYLDHRLLRVRGIEFKKSKEKFVYSLKARKYHSILVNEYIITHQCDGDEDGLMLLMDCLLNFSLHYLPSKIGGKMDEPLVISVRLDPNEIDSEAHNIDTLYQYPLEFYESTEKYLDPIELIDKMELESTRLGSELQFEQLGFTHPTESINAGPLTTAYKLYEKIDEKIHAQLYLAKIIKSVNAQDVARRILKTHFTPDILGNLRSFTNQNFRCVKCNEKYRRPPLYTGGVCKCGGKIILTVNRGGIEKYIPRSLKIIKEFDLDNYTKQKMELIESYVKSVANNPKIRQHHLSDFF